MRLFSITQLGMIFGLVLWSAFTSAEVNRVTLPDVNDLVHYTTVTRGNVTEYMYTTQEAIDALQKGQPAPYGTHFVLEDHRDGEIYRYFIMEKGENWGQDYTASRRTGDWQFQWFWGDGSINMNENTERCQSCHRSRENQEYTFLYRDLMSFKHP